MPWDWQAAKRGYGKAHLAVTPGHEASTPLHAGIKAVPAPIGLAAHVAHLALGDVHHRLIAGAGAVYKLHTGQTFRIAGVGGPAAEDQGLLPSVCRYTWYISSWSGRQQFRTPREEMGLLVRVTFKM